MSAGLKGRSRIFLIGLLFLIVQSQALATHLRAGEITVTRVCTGFTFKITITVYTNTGSTVRFSNDQDGNLNFGDGSPVFHPPQQENQAVAGFPGVGYVSYSTYHTYGGNGVYVISYQEPNRNAGILNMDNSVNTPFYIETKVTIDPFLGCDNSPQLLVPPIDKACTGVPWYHNPGAYDPDGDSLSYEMVVPKQDQLDDVEGYLPPNSNQPNPQTGKGFYSSIGLNYGTSNAAGDGPPTFGIDSLTGTVTWDAPGATGEYNIAFIIKEWRKRSGVWVLMGYVTRDMQIIVENCMNNPPKLIPPVDICVVAGTTISQQILGYDPDSDSVKIEAFSQVFTINPSPAVMVPSPPIFQASSPTTDAVVTFTWTTNCLHVKEQPYQVVFKITDKPKANTGGIALVSFTTWNIKVVGPAPIWTSVQAQPGRTAKLTWQNYVCSDAADTMQVWRRVNSYPYDPPPCVTGMPGFLGFTKIAQVPIGTTQYVDTNGGKGLPAGAEYCYRLVAIFPLPEGGESYVSKESCFTVKADAPIITNVSIDLTSPTVGQDTIKWLSPLASDIDTTQFPPPYKYSLYRAEGFSGNINKTLVFPGKTDNTFYIDTGSDKDPLNTAGTVYNYRVVAFYHDSLAVDTSATASTVKLALKSHVNNIELNWSAAVPWSNQTVNYPHHYVYRGPANSSALSDLQLIDSINVNQYQFHYIDSGQWNHMALDKTQTYCYCVRTEGSYGNPQIRAPLLNYSQIICGKPNDTIPPCKPVLNVTATDCASVIQSKCNATSTFFNTLTWQSPTTDCQSETYVYNIYMAAQSGGTYTPYKLNYMSTIFYDSNLASYARCYKVTAVSKAGIESEFSDPICFDNCPNYELPNVFTPGNGDLLNDKFRAYGDPTDQNAGGEGAVIDNSKCARFVNQVVFTVYNRWGKEVFTYQSGGENSIYIDWDGRDDQGKELAAGVYYYLAEVNFNVVDPAKQNKNIKGWVQIVR